MSKTLLIIAREYLTRVKKKSFLITTILAPVGMILLFCMQIFILLLDTGEVKRIMVKDDSGLFSHTTVSGQTQIRDLGNMQFTLAQGELEPLTSSYKEQGMDGLLYIPNNHYEDNQKNVFQLQYISDQPLGINNVAIINRKLAKEIRNARLSAANIDPDLLQKLDNINIDILERADDGNEVNSGLAFGFGMGVGFLMYFIIIVYGTMVMKGVMEEKTNRIVEVILSSVRPFQLMLGKIIGIGAVGVTQFIIWIILAGSMYLFLGLLLAGYLPNPESISGPSMMGGTPAEAVDMDEMQFKIQMILDRVGSFNLPLLIGIFVFYFLGGYLLYAALFAAVGSAVGDDSSDSQALVFPITIPIMISFFIMMAVVNQPNSSLAFWSSIFPLSSPLIMPALMPFSPPWWQILLSMIMLIIGFVFTTALAAKIYRTGILMWGKKITFRELAKWALK